VILVGDVDACQHVVAELGAQAAADGGVGLVGARHPRDRAHEGMVETVGIKSHLLQIGARTLDFTANVGGRPNAQGENASGAPVDAPQFARGSSGAQSPQSKSWHCC
jgi:hypothetical protein